MNCEDPNDTCVWPDHCSCYGRENVTDKEIELVTLDYLELATKLRGLEDIIEKE